MGPLTFVFSTRMGGGGGQKNGALHFSFPPDSKWGKSKRFQVNPNFSMTEQDKKHKKCSAVYVLCL